ncbi:HAMP domain-containing sensor histidine kinase [Mucilaginibacter sp. KACC 22063]|uniref:HAMP domain-containing sensor histidine kinase n=1 Tax=Mucilaginibacter sp. KACC 22063 TaxID=3025666 RepID=UPI002367065C|nr:ATP-binding protein [Mucilaginibacter sp. KACC 22063]WDF54432.1 ATP-binding protein [Mucilaginibacter sp. KACC 22063]
MKIKDRLAFYYTLLSSGTLLIIMTVMYLAFYVFFRSDFYDRLNDRAKVAAQLYLDADELPTDSLTRLRERMISALPEEVIRIYNAKNMASFIRDKQQYWSDDIIDRVRQDKSATFTEGSYQTIGINYRDNQGDFVIMVSAHDKQGQRRLSVILRIMLIIFLGVNGMFFFIGRLFAKQALSPIDQLISQIKSITASNLHLRLDEGNGKDEISTLAGNFNQLLEHLQNSFELQQTFIANASHELRTPLTSIIGEIEVSLNRERDPAYYTQLLASILADSNRLSATVTSLMDLAQTDLNYTQARREPLQIDDLIWEIQAYWASQKPHKVLNIDIGELPADPQQLVIMADKHLLAIAFNNIIGNAFKFSENKPVTLRLESVDKNLIISITDQGIGIPASDLETIFKPFYRSINGRSFQGNGIGLYVTQKIIQLYNGTISIVSRENFGTTFQIIFRSVF